ncbi:UNVERIFIED_CONTAM: hypothetical protein RMT77_004195 [Armadillidium vulgare]
MWVAALVIFLTSIFCWICLKKPSEYPPGPWGLPLIGWPPLSLESFLRTLSKLRKKNHDIVGWRIGSKYVVSLLDYDLYKDAYQHPGIAFRPQLNSLTYVRGKEILGIVLPGGDIWTQNRRFALRHLRDFGMGKEKLLFDAHFEADNLVNDFKTIVGKPTPVPHTLLIAILNTAWQMIASVRYAYDDKDINEFIELISETHIYGPRLIILDLFPWLNKILPPFLIDFLFKHKVQADLSDKIKAYFQKHIDIHMKDLYEENCKDYIDAYLLEMEKQKDNPDSTLSIEDLKFCLSDLFEGSSETTSLTLHWAILYLTKYPNVQKKLQAEIDEVLPKGFQFVMKDKTKLPYTDAFITELLRITSVVSIPPRAAGEDTRIGPYFIPKGSWVFGESYVVHHDPKYWDSPNELRPERFLDSNGKFVAPSKAFVPFGYGKRFCIGENIARMQLFVFMTKLIQNFQFDCPLGENITLEGVISPFFRPPKGSPKVLITLR